MFWVSLSCSMFGMLLLLIFSLSEFQISTAMCLGVSLHVILTTIYLQVYGQGLSIHGPIGSMARAVAGMREETKEVFIAYILMAIFFAISMLTSFWTVMTVRAASISSAFFIFISYQWWRYCLRIYNKFYVKRLFFLGADDIVDREAERDPTKVHKEHTNSRTASTAGVTPAYQPQEPSTLLGKLVSVFGKKEGDRDVEKGNNVDMTDPVSNTDNTADGEHWDTAHMQGNLSINEAEAVTKKKGIFRTSRSTITVDNWIRRYVVVTMEGELYLYKNRFHFREEPDNSLRSRPIRLCDYNIRQEISKDPKLKIDVHYIVLEHKDKEEGIRPWTFRCDSAEECSQWIGALESGAAFCD
jgi:hypothetical protein